MADETDEVKVFRVHDEDESDAPSLADDKKDVALEEEMECKPFFDGKGAFQPLPASPAFGSMFPYSPGVMNPFQIALMSQAATAASMAANAYIALSPHFPGLPMPSSPLDMYTRALVAAASPLAGPKVGMMGGMPGMPLPSAYPPNPLAHMQMMGGYGMGGMAPSTSTSTPHTPNTTKRKRIKEEKEEHIKKPKNAYFWFMDENRKKLMIEDEWKDKQSADLNKELGQRWQSMNEQEKQPYFELAKKDKDEHNIKYPNWSARENYANSIKRKKKKDRTVEPGDGKKCRARFGMTEQDKWCKHCLRKKKCMYVRGGGADDEERASSHSAQRATDSESDLDDEPIHGTLDDDTKMVLTTNLPAIPTITPMPLTPSFSLNSLLHRQLTLP
ncbi:hypothetical protein PFISCL1PPCAC_19407 [Pristionchus fissidentatus]|uniref:HMG box domain-containing protein n=1 Tax=Pristionchus fissidentatus TaxID=1538716 RepID=A0AAV5WCH8_9BILA|nr:hypothetical protein PFISCL1PPCAC_19407 [Pristionchus fissidentatus]